MENHMIEVVLALSTANLATIFLLFRRPLGREEKDKIKDIHNWIDKEVSVAYSRTQYMKSLEQIASRVESVHRHMMKITQQNYDKIKMLGMLKESVDKCHARVFNK